MNLKTSFTCPIKSISIKAGSNNVHLTTNHSKNYIKLKIEFWAIFLVYIFYWNSFWFSNYNWQYRLHLKAKKNLTSTITTLNHLHIVLGGVDDLERITKERDYLKASNLLQGVSNVIEHLDVYSKTVPEVKDLRSWSWLSLLFQGKIS